MPSRIFFFSDIDDTLIQTRRKTNFNKSTVVGAYNKEGDENSFFYEGTKVLIDALLESNINFIPTTARNLDSYKRTTLYNEKAIRYAILNFGGTILVNNKVDILWEKQIKEQYSKITPMPYIYDDLLTKLSKDNLNLVIKIIDNFYISIYNKYHLDDEDYLKNIKDKLQIFLQTNTDFYLYENNNSFAILPIFLNKKFAVKYLIEKDKPILTMGAGDNISDLDFMNITSFHVIPHGSSIHSLYTK